MSRKCQLTGKAPRSGNNRPFSLKITKRVFRPNIFIKRVLNPLTGKVERMKLSAKAIRTLKKWDREANKGGVENAEKTKTKTTTTKNRVKKDHLTPKQKKEQLEKEELEKKKAVEIKNQAEKEA